MKDKSTPAVVLDVGCGNGRNSEFMIKKGHGVMSLDMAGDYGHPMVLGKDKLPTGNNSVDIILCNYMMMFLNQKERNQLIQEIKRVSKDGCIIILELYPAKDSYANTQEKMVKLQRTIFNKLGWDKIRYSKGRFIAKKL
jgi:ubiquinone/menaquinone biosynthesis C-methylase UbiE